MNTPSIMASQLGARLKQARLNGNITQAHLATQAGISLKILRGVERGQASLEAVMAVLLALGLADQLDHFVPPQPISPIQLLKLQGQSRRRASHPEPLGIKEEPPQW